MTVGGPRRGPLAHGLPRPVRPCPKGGRPFPQLGRAFHGLRRQGRAVTRDRGRRSSAARPGPERLETAGAEDGRRPQPDGRDAVTSRAGARRAGRRARRVTALRARLPGVGVLVLVVLGDQLPDGRHEVSGDLHEGVVRAGENGLVF